MDGNPTTWHRAAAKARWRIGAMDAWYGFRIY
jgi:hypothetical protein